jgi:hypothetical protein
VSHSTWPACIPWQFGEIPAAVVLAAILQRGSAIKSAGGYLRGLTRKAEAGQFRLGPDADGIDQYAKPREAPRMIESGVRGRQSQEPCVGSISLPHQCWGLVQTHALQR